MPDRSHHREGQHHERDVPVPAMPGAGLVVSQPELCLGGLESILDRPASPLDRNERLDGKPVSSMTSTASDHVRDLDDIIAYEIAQRIGIPVITPKKLLLAPWTGIAAASARIQPVLRRSAPSSPSMNAPALAAVRCCGNSGRIRLFTSRKDDAHNSSVVSTEPLRHP